VYASKQLESTPTSYWIVNIWTGGKSRAAYNLI